MASDFLSMPFGDHGSSSKSIRRKAALPIWYVYIDIHIEIAVLTSFEAFFESDPVDFALSWMDPSDKTAIPVIMPANDKRAGGDWEAGIFSSKIIS